VLLHGVDFSGADSGGSAKIRVVTRDLADLRSPVRVEPRADRERLKRTILASASDGRPHLWRIDAPFSLPLETLEAHRVGPAWLDMARWMRDFGTPRGWRVALRDTSRREPRRTCDRVFHAPMAPMNLRVFKQTWTLICEVLLPLAESGLRIDAVHEVRSPATLVEGCPASVLFLRDWPSRGYKGKGEPPRLVRADLVKRLERDGLRIPKPVADDAISDEEGDLLDAILLVTDPVAGPPPAEAVREGWIR
jgi:hypothetical protein